MCRAGNADAIRRRARLQARGEVDGAAEEIASPDHAVADVHHDPEVDATVRGYPIVGFRTRGLGLDGALDRINGACKFRQHAVASGICDPAAMRRDQAVQNLAPLGQIPKRSDLVPPHQAAIAFDVGRENRHKPALDISHLGLDPPWTALTAYRGFSGRNTSTSGCASRI